MVRVSTVAGMSRHGRAEIRMPRGIVSRDCEDSVHVDIGTAAEGILEKFCCKRTRMYRNFSSDISSNLSMVQAR